MSYEWEVRVVGVHSERRDSGRDAHRSPSKDVELNDELEEKGYGEKQRCQWRTREGRRGAAFARGRVWRREEDSSLKPFCFHQTTSENKKELYSWSVLI
jgi:hypothetical protein